MDDRKSQVADEGDQAPSSGPWSVTRVEVISTVDHRRHSIGRVELWHNKRGRVLAVGTGPGSVDAIFSALAQLFDLETSVRTLQAQYQFQEAADPRQVAASIEILIEGKCYRGSARAAGMLVSVAAAFLDAICRAADERQVKMGRMAS